MRCCSSLSLAVALKVHRTKHFRPPLAVTAAWVGKLGCECRAIT
jgi:hypothetical protein